MISQSFWYASKALMPDAVTVTCKHRWFLRCFETGFSKVLVRKGVLISRKSDFWGEQRLCVIWIYTFLDAAALRLH